MRKLTAEERCGLLLEMSRRSRGTLDLEETLGRLLDSAGAVVGYDAAGVFALSDDLYPVRARPEGKIAGVVRRGFLVRPVSEDAMLRSGAGIVGAAIASGETVAVPDVRLDPRYVVGREQTLSEVAVPIRVDGRTIAALNVEFDRVAAFDERDVELLEFLAEAAAMAIEKAMLHRHLLDREQLEAQLRIARDVQVGLLPRAAPRVEGYDVAAVCLPSLELGGDCYDFFPLAGGRLGFVIGDVAGKGVPAALTMATFRALLRARRETGPGLSGTMAAVSRLLRESSGPRSFVTAVFAALEPGTGRLDYVGGGHPAGVVTRADGATEELSNCGPVLGVFDEAAYVERSTTLFPGDQLVLYTDGLVEERNAAGEQFGIERVRAVLGATRSRPAAAVAEELVREVRGFCASPQLADDLTLVLLRRMPGA